MTGPYRTDDHNNPTAMTTATARQGGLVLDQDFQIGEPFMAGTIELYTAKLLGDPVQLTIRVIDKIGFYTSSDSSRWVYIGMPDFVWGTLTTSQKRDVIGWMYQREGGTAMRGLFPNYGRK